MKSVKKSKGEWRFIVVSGLSTAAILFVGVVALYFIVNATVRNIIYENVIEIAQRDKQLYANEIDAWFSRRYNTVRNFATTLSALSTPQERRGSHFREYDETDRIFREIAERFVYDYGSVINAFIGFDDGSIINGSGFRPPPHLPWSATERPWFSAAVEAGAGVTITTEPYWSEIAGSFTAGMATWLPELNGIGAVVGISVTQQNIFDRIAHDPVLADGYRLLVTNDGEIIFHSNPDVMANENVRNLLDIPGGDGAYLLEVVQSGTSFSTFFGQRHGYSYIVAAPLETVGWTLFDIVPVDAVQGPISETVTAIMIPIVFLISVMFLFSMVLFFYMARQREHKLDLDKKLAEANNEAKSKFLARMSHEIRTPITAVMGISEIQLQSTNLPHAVEESFATIHSSSVLLLEIVNDILDFAKIESGKMLILSERYEVASLISDTVHLHTALLGEKDIKFQINADENLPVSLVGDIVRIKQIINNLLSNAFKYTEKGVVEFNLKRENGELCITIRDTGLGMSRMQLVDLFAEYSRFHEHETRYIAGVGLGMPIVNNLVKLMDGRIDVDSEVGRGTTVVVSIPQAAFGDEVIGAEAANRFRDIENPVEYFSKRFVFTPESMPYGSVLIVDDIEANHYVTRGLLAFYDLKIESCYSGSEAIEKIKQGNVYDIIFMDYMMPGMNGNEAMHRLRELEYARPIIALTANAVIGQAEELIKEGFDDFISKPIKTKLLNDILVRYICDRHPREVVEAARAAKTAGNKDIHDFQNDPVLIAKLKDDFLRCHVSAFADLCNSLENGDIETAHRLAHTVKSSAGLLHEGDLVHVAEEIELILAKKEHPAKTQLDALEREISRVLDVIGEEAVASMPQEVVAYLSPDEAVALLDKVSPLLKSKNVASTDMLDELRKIPGSLELCKNIENYEFDVALGILDGLRVGLVR